MPFYSYYKALPKTPSAINVFENRIIKRLFKLLPNVLIVVGATAVTTVLYPMLSYHLLTIRWEESRLTTPIPREEWDVVRGIAKSLPQESNPTNPAQPVIAYQGDNDQPEIVDDIDYTKAENWFSITQSSTKGQKIVSKVTSYTLSIPKVNIENMNVVIGDNDLDRHLVHYGGTAMPGEYGNPVIFGHSVLPLFYNPKNYKSIFSKVPTLKKGDEIFIDYDGIRYKYVVESYHEVQPSQVEVLEQRYDRQTLTLITCVPPGTYLRRGVILAVLEK